MAESMAVYPRRCRENIRRITEEIGTSAETAYGMMLMTAMFMDLHPEDRDVLHIILKDCGVEVDDE